MNKFVFGPLRPSGVQRSLVPHPSANQETLGVPVRDNEGAGYSMTSMISTPMCENPQFIVHLRNALQLHSSDHKYHSALSRTRLRFIYLI